MARPLRIEYAGACYHVMNRGNRRTRVFRRGKHYKLFIDRLGRFCEEFDVGVHSFCCMPNHFHLLLTTREANLSRFMHSFLTSFSISLNRMCRTSGHVFQGRFKAELVEAQRYLSEASRYVHLNPVRTKRFRHLEFAQRKHELDNFPWSSYRVLIGLEKQPGWLDVEPVLHCWASAREEAMQNYRRYVEQGLTVRLPDPFLSVREQTILGSDSFADKIRRKYLLKRGVRDEQQEVSLKHLLRSISVEDVVSAVADVYDISRAEVLKRRSRHADARKLAMYLAVRLSRHAQSLSELADCFGVTGAALSIAAKRADEVLSKGQNRAFRVQCQQAKNLLKAPGEVDS